MDKILTLEAVNKTFVNIGNVNLFYDLENRDLEPNRNLFKKLLNYLKVVLFLVETIVFWILFGWLADYAFPFGHALELMIACFQGTVSAKINNLQKQLQRTDIFNQPDNIEQVKRLNNLESQGWLYQSVLKYLGRDTYDSHERIAKTLEALEYKTNEILQYLEPRRPNKYRIFVKIQEYFRSILPIQAEKDYLLIENIVNRLIDFTSIRQPSANILLDVITQTFVEIRTNSRSITPSRLVLALKIHQLLKVISRKLILNNDLNAQLNTLSEQFNNLLFERQHITNELDKTYLENIKLTLCLSKRDTHIAELQTEINKLVEKDRLKQLQLDDLNQHLDNLSKNSSTASFQIKTQPKISLEDYVNAINKKDYVYVRSHYRKKPSRRNNRV